MTFKYEKKKKIEDKETKKRKTVIYISKKKVQKRIFLITVIGVTFYCSLASD